MTNTTPGTATWIPVAVCVIFVAAVASQDANDPDFPAARRLLVGTSLFVAFVNSLTACIVVNQYNLSFLVSFCLVVSIFFLSMTLHPVVGSFMVNGHLELRKWAFEGVVEPIPRSGLTALSAIWPLVVCYSLMVYPCVGIIHRVFKEPK